MKKTSGPQLASPFRVSAQFENDCVTLGSRSDGCTFWWNGLGTWLRATYVLVLSFCRGEHPRGARGQALTCWNVGSPIWLCFYTSMFGFYRLVGTRYDKRTETKVARSLDPNSFHQKAHSNDWYFWWKPGTLLNPLNACIDGNWCGSRHGYLHICYKLDDFCPSFQYFTLNLNHFL